MYEDMTREGGSVVRNVRSQLPRPRQPKTCGRLGLWGEDGQAICGACPDSLGIPSFLPAGVGGRRPESGSSEVYPRKDV
jgi:hypothetical protein